jgi:hypothetical protein
MSLPRPSAAHNMHSGGVADLDAWPSDPIIEELRAYRDEYAKSLGYDLAAIVADLRSRQERHPERIVSLPPRRVNK